MRSALLLLVALAAVACSTPAPKAPATPEVPVVAADPAREQLLKDLQDAFNGESNAHAKYVEFAKKADEEGFKKAAVLFRAAAKAEEIHAGSHGKVITSLGGIPKADIKAPEVKTTAENLKAALDGETYEKDVMYPAMIEHAKAARNMDALKAFNQAMKAEIDHAGFYSSALASLDSWKSAGAVFLVCPVCGHTVEKMNEPKCPVCFEDKEKFLSIL